VWPPFVLIAGLLVVGAVVEEDGLFEAIGGRVERIGGGPTVLLAALLSLEAVVTAVLNLDTAAVFVTPIVIHAARQRGCDERPFLYGALFMANSASLLLPGSNLTNLIVLAHSHLSGAAFARAMALPWLGSVVITIVFLAVVYRPRDVGGSPDPIVPFRVGLGLVLAIVVTVLILALHDAALPVLAIGVAGVVLRRLRPEVSVRVLASLFLLAVMVGALARRWNGPASLLSHTGGLGVAALGAVASVAINNLPAATLLSARPSAHPFPLLIGLNLGPNLLVTGSLSAYLWYRAASRVGARPSLVRASVLGLALVPLTVAVAFGALALGDPHAV
jgi:arsenical pump membrane protein